MHYKSQIAAAAGAIALSVVAPAFADSQLIASAGLTVEQAEGMTLTQIIQHKFNRDERPSDRWDPSIPVGRTTGARGQLAATAGVAPEAAQYMSLNELVVAKFNRDSRPDDQQTLVPQSDVVVMTRSMNQATNRFGQLIASAGLTPSEAEGLTLTEIVQYKFDRDVPQGDRQMAYSR